MSTITVTSGADSGAGSLRAAIASADAGDIIVFAVTSIQLASTLIVDKNLTIEGTAGRNLIDIHQGLGDGSAVVVEAGADVTFAYLNINSFDHGQNAADDAIAGSDGDNGVAGLNGTKPGDSGTKGGDGDPGGAATMATGKAVGPAPALENDGTLTLVQCEIDGANGTGANGADGADGGGGGVGGAGGDGVKPGNGANGGIGGDGGAGSNGTDGGNAVGGVINTGVLTLQDSVISGQAVAGDGGNGGKGGAAGDGGAGGRGANDGEGGAGGDGGEGGAGGNGGSAVGGIVNTGTVDIVGAAVLFGDSAQAGNGGGGGEGGAAGDGGIGNGNGANGDTGANGASGVSGTQTDDYLDKGSTQGEFTVNGYLYDFVRSAPLPGVAGNGTPTQFDYQVEEFGGYTSGFPQAGSVEWKVVTGAGGPPLGDFVGPTSGTLSYNADRSGDFLFDDIVVTLSGDAAAPRNEAFSVELFNPATGDVLGSVSSVSQNVTNALAPVGSNLAVSFNATPGHFRGNGATTLTGTTSNGVTSVAIYNLDGDTSVPLGTVTPSGGAWSFTAALPAGVYQFEAIATDGATVAAADGPYLLTVGAAGAPSFEYYGNVSGQSYSSYEYEFQNGNFIGSQFFYTNVPANAPYSGYEYEYDGGGHLIRADFVGAAGAPYSSYDYDYVGSVFAGSKFVVSSVPTGATYSFYELDYDYANAFSGEKFFFNAVSDEPYSNEEEDFDAELKLSRILLGGFANAPYSSLELDYAAGVYQGEKAIYTENGPVYSQLEVDVNATGLISKIVYSELTGTPYQSVEQDYVNGALATTTFGYTEVTGHPYNAYQVATANGAALSEIFDFNSGAHTQIALAPNQTLTSLGLDKMTGDGATTFVLNAIYGADTITNFNAADTMSLAASEYSQLSSAISGGNYAGGNATLSFSDGDTLTFKNMTQAQLLALGGNFT